MTKDNDSGLFSAVTLSLSEDSTVYGSVGIITIPLNNSVQEACEGLLRREEHHIVLQDGFGKGTEVDALFMFGIHKASYLSIISFYRKCFLWNYSIFWPKQELKDFRTFHR